MPAFAAPMIDLAPEGAMAVWLVIEAGLALRRYRRDNGAVGLEVTFADRADG